MESAYAPACMALQDQICRDAVVSYTCKIVSMNYLLKCSGLDQKGGQCLFETLQRLGSPHDGVNDMVFLRGHWTMRKEASRFPLKFSHAADHAFDW